MSDRQYEPIYDQNLDGPRQTFQTTAGPDLCSPTISDMLLAACTTSSLHTKTLLEKHALEEDVLLIFTLIPNTNLLIQGAEIWLDKVHGPHAVWCEADPSSVTRSDRDTSYVAVTSSNKPYDRVLLCTLVKSEGNTSLVKTHSQSQPTNAGPCIDVSKASPSCARPTLPTMATWKSSVVLLIMMSCVSDCICCIVSCG
jgi:hypothetical protein